MANGILAGSAAGSRGFPGATAGNTTEILLANVQAAVASLSPAPGSTTTVNLARADAEAANNALVTALGSGATTTGNLEARLLANARAAATELGAVKTAIASLVGTSAPPASAPIGDFVTAMQSFVSGLQAQVASLRDDGMGPAATALRNRVASPNRNLPQETAQLQRGRALSIARRSDIIFADQGTASPVGHVSSPLSGSAATSVIAPSAFNGICSAAPCRVGRVSFPAAAVRRDPFSRDLRPNPESLLPKADGDSLAVVTVNGTTLLQTLQKQPIARTAAEAPNANIGYGEGRSATLFGAWMQDSGFGIIADRLGLPGEASSSDRVVLAVATGDRPTVAAIDLVSGGVVYNYTAPNVAITWEGAMVGRQVAANASTVTDGELIQGRSRLTFNPGRTTFAQGAVVAPVGTVGTMNASFSGIRNLVTGAGITSFDLDDVPVTPEGTYSIVDTPLNGTPGLGRIQGAIFGNDFGETAGTFSVNRTGTDTIVGAFGAINRDQTQPRINPAIVHNR